MNDISNTFLGITLLLFVALALPTTVQSVVRRSERDASLCFTLLGISNALWGVCNALFYLLPDEHTALLFFEMRLVFICCSSIFTYLFTLRSFRHMTLSWQALAGIFAIPAITAALVLTGDAYQLLRMHMDIVILDGIRAVSRSNGPWFWVHCVMGYGGMFLALRLMVLQFKRLPDYYRTSVIIMMSSILATAIATLFSLFNLVPYSIDPSSAIVQISQIFFFFALYKSHSMDDLFTSRDAVFANAGNAIFVVSLNGGIVDYNKKAEEMSDALGIGSLYDAPFDELVEKWIDHYSAHRLKEDDSIITVNSKGADIHYQITRNEFVNSKGSVIGSFVEFKDITPIMTLIHTLQDFAYYDQLTGLLNRRSFAQKLMDYDRPKYLPIGLMMGDINNLKPVNDTYGHAAGDVLLRSVTEILRKEAPKRAYWFRIGGDEFAAIIPNTTEQAMQKLIDAIQKRCDALDDPRFAGSGIALAFRMREHMSQDMAALLAEADQAMYADKWNRRRT